MEIPARRVGHKHVDLVGPQPVSSEGFAYFFTMIDLSTRWLEAIQLRSMEASTCPDDLIVSWVPIHDRPTTITSKHSLQYSSSVWATM
jgi:hypothetical protein